MEAIEEYATVEAEEAITAESYEELYEIMAKKYGSSLAKHILAAY